MSRRKNASKRPVMPDPVFHSEMITRFINCVMQDGKKSVAEHIVYQALASVVSEGSEDRSLRGFKALENERAKKLALDALTKAFENAGPRVEVKSRRVGGSTYQVPVEVRKERREALAMRNLVDSAAARGEKSMPEKLAGEIKDAMQNKGAAVKRREDIHKMAEANKAFAHYRW